MARWWRKKEQRGLTGPAPTGRSEPPIDRLGVDGTPVPLRTELAGFEQDVRAQRVALLRTDFLVFSAVTQAYPLFQLVESGAGNITSRSTLCCLRCSARHSIPALQAVMLTGRPPVDACQRCGCIDAVLVFDPEAPAGDAPHELTRLTGAGRRVERVLLLTGAGLPPAAVQSAVRLLGEGEDFTGATVTVKTVPAGHADVEGLADAVVALEESQGQVSAGALERRRLLWVRLPPHGDVLAVVITAPA